MKLVVFGLTVSSSWGNGHATIWRALGRALAERGHRVVFFERDTPYYSAHRDCTTLEGIDLRLYPSWAVARAEAARELRTADAGMVTSYCPDGPAACQLVLDSTASVKAFYDLDTPVTLDRLDRGETVEYLPPDGLGEFDLVLSYTGGLALEALRDRLGARNVRPLYGSVDPVVHRPEPIAPSAALSYLGTYAADRQPALDMLFLEPARRRPERRFVIGGSLYPRSFEWLPNVWYVHHVAPGDHARFYRESRITLNITRRAMADMGYCPSGRLFEAAACGVPILSDWWEGLDTFFEPGSEILVARQSDDTLAGIDLDDRALAHVSAAARERVLADHTAERRAEDLESALEWVRSARAPGEGTEPRRDGSSAVSA